MKKMKFAAAVGAAVEQLFDKENGLVRLFTPPFAGEEAPGYISAYGPGFRENGDRADRDNQEQAGSGRERGRRDRGRNRGDRRREGRPRREDGGDSAPSANSEKAPQ